MSNRRSGTRSAPTGAFRALCRFTVRIIARPPGPRRMITTRSTLAVGLKPPAWMTACRLLMSPGMSITPGAPTSPPTKTFRAPTDFTWMTTSGRKSWLA